MSVILDALHKARGDRRNKGAEPHEQTVARVVDAGLAPQNTFNTAPARSGGGRGWLLAIAILCGIILLVVLIAGAFFLLYDQMRRIETAATKPVPAATTESAPAPVAGQLPVQPAPPPAAILQTPVPLTELPVQSPTLAAAPTTAAKPEFDLGSIVCENNDCIASLNNRSVRVGDSIKGYKITHIDSSSITLKGEANGDVITLSLFD